MPPVYAEKLVVKKLVSVKRERGSRMQKSVIYFKRTLPEKVIQLLVSISNDAFNNREGKIVGNRESTYCLSYGGDESMYGCLQLGMLELEDNKDFLRFVCDWKWIDEEYPEENYSVWRIMEKSLKE